jgi:beta-glucosidase
MQEWESNWGGRAVIEYGRKYNEDVFLDACTDDDFIGVNTYTRTRLDLGLGIGLLSRLALAVPPLERRIVPRVVEQVRDAEGPEAFGQAAFRKTDMGYEWRPAAAAACVRRVAERFPGKPILATEHGVATEKDEERIEFIRDGLIALHQVIADGIPLRGYLHWSAFDNFEWALGYGMKFGLVGVDPKTQVRDIRPSARYLGEIARTNKLVVE